MATMVRNCYANLMQCTVTIDENGVITIPAAIRQAFGLLPNDELILEATEDGILLRPWSSVPSEVYSESRIAEFSSDEPAIGRLLPESM